MALLGPVLAAITTLLSFASVRLLFCARSLLLMLFVVVSIRKPSVLLSTPGSYLTVVSSLVV